MSFITQITRGLKSINIKGISGKGFGRLTSKGTKATSANQLSMSPLGDNMANLGKHLNGPKQDMVNLASKATSANQLSTSPLGDNMANLGKHLNGPKQDMVNLTSKATSANPLSMSPLGDNMANLGKHLNGPKQDMVNLASKAPKALPEAKASLRRTSPPTPSTPTGREQALKSKSTSGTTGQPLKSSLDHDPYFQYLEKQYGARRADASTTAALTTKGASKPNAPTALTTRQRSEKLKTYTAQSREIGQTVKSLQKNPALTPEVKHQLIQEEVRKLADVQKKAAAIMTPKSTAQPSVLQSRKTLQANLQASKTGTQGQLPNVPVVTQQARDAAATRLMAQQRALRATQAQQDQQRLTQAWAPDAKAMSQPQVRVPRKNPYINDALEKPASARPLSGDFEVVEGWNSNIIMNP